MNKNKDQKPVTKDEFYEAIETARRYRRQIAAEYNDVDNLITNVGLRFLSVKKGDKLIDTDCSVRLLNRLYNKIGKGFYYCKVKDLSKVSLYEMKKERGFGEASLKELMELCLCAGVKLRP